jgi:hypothetical protein
VAADFWVRPIRCDEWFVICSDGLTGEVDDERITEVLSRATEPDQVADELLTLALDHGGKDNVTVIVLHVTGVGDTIEITTETRDRVAPDDPSGASLIQMVPVGIAAAATSPERPMVRLIEELPAMLRQPDIDEAPEAAPDSSDAPPPTLIEAMPTELAHADPEATTGVNDEPT